MVGPRRRSCGDGRIPPHPFLLFQESSSQPASPFPSPPPCLAYPEWHYTRGTQAPPPRAVGRGPEFTGRFIVLRGVGGRGGGGGGEMTAGRRFCCPLFRGAGTAMLLATPKPPPHDPPARRGGRGLWRPTAPAGPGPEGQQIPDPPHPSAPLAAARLARPPAAGRSTPAEGPGRAAPQRRKTDPGAGPCYRQDAGRAVCAPAGEQRLRRRRVGG